MAAPYVHVWLHSAHAHSPRAAYAPQHPAWIVLAFLDRAGNLVLILIGPHAIDSCTACRSTDSFAATTGNTAFPLAGQHIVTKTTTDHKIR